MKRPLVQSSSTEVQEAGSKQQLESDRNVYSHQPSSTYEGTVSIGGKANTNLCFADDINGLAEEEEELANLAAHLDKASTAYGMEISAKKTKLMTNNTSGKPEIISRIAQTTATMTR